MTEGEKGVGGWRGVGGGTRRAAPGAGAGRDQAPASGHGGAKAPPHALAARARSRDGARRAPDSAPPRPTAPAVPRTLM